MLEELKKKGYKFQIDSRKIKSGEVFLCLKGENTDGHLFIEDALKKGADFVVIDNPSFANNLPNNKIIKVDNVLEEMLISSSQIVNNNSKIKIGITGSTGKTTTKECLYYLLSPFFTTFRNELNMNTEIGIPLSILNQYSNEDVSIIEIGLKQKGDLDFVTRFYKLDVAFITNVGPSHLEFLETIENVAQEKMKITNNMNKGLLILNGDYPILKELAPKRLKTLSFGLKKSNDAVLEGYEYNLNYTTTFYAKILGNHLMLTLNKYWSEGQILDLLSTLLFLTYIELPLDPFIICNIDIPEGRFQTITRENTLVINDSYNASYDSFNSAFKSISQIDFYPKILVMGEMKELGEYSKYYHEKVLSEAKEIFDEIYIYDPDNKLNYLLQNQDKIIKFESLDDITKIISEIKEGLIYIKASNSTGIYEYLKNNL